MEKLSQERVSVEVDGNTVARCLCTRYYNGRASVMMVDHVSVNRSERGRGYGTDLMVKVIGIAKEKLVDSVELVVNPDNKIAKKLYHKVGFEKADKEYYRLILRRFNG